MPFIKIIEPEEAESKLKDIYNNLEKSRGKIAEVHKIQSLNPESITAHMDLYIQIMYRSSPLSRLEREMIGTVVSATNNCEYCVRHHAEAMNYYWKDAARLEKFVVDYNNSNLSEREINLCNYAKALTEDVSKSKEDQLAKSLLSNGFTDREVLDATLVIGYFNFVNRVVHGLGVELEKDGGKGYKFD